MKKQLLFACTFFYLLTTTLGQISSTDFYSSVISLPEDQFNQPRIPVLNDFNADGKTDMAISNDALQKLVIFTNTSTSASTPAFEIVKEFDIPGMRGLNMISGDIDEDGFPEIVVADFNNKNAIIYKNITLSAGGTIDFENWKSFSGSDLMIAVCLADINNDNKPDLLINSKQDEVAAYINTSSTGDPGFSTTAAFTLTVPEVSNIEGADFDNDGLIDLIVSSNSENASGGKSVYVYLNTSTSSVSFDTPVQLTAVNGIYNTAIADLDGDGLKDIMASHWASGVGNSISIFRNTSSGEGNISFSPDASIPLETAPTYIKAKDLNDDSKPDLTIALYGDGSNDKVAIFENTSSNAGTIDFDSEIDLTGEEGVLGIDMGDIDGDTKIDIVVANTYANSITLFTHSILNGIIDRKNSADRLSVFPNIISESATVHIPETETDVTLQVISLSGNTMIELNNFSGKEAKLNFSEIPSGIYMIQVSGKAVYFAKVVVE